MKLIVRLKTLVPSSTIPQSGERIDHGNPNEAPGVRASCTSSITDDETRDPMELKRKHGQLDNVNSNAEWHYIEEYAEKRISSPKQKDAAEIERIGSIERSFGSLGK